MKTTEQTCAEIELRLVEGRPATDDPAVAAHLRSCLRCFRTASELRQAPQIAALLRQGQQNDQPDPGDLFWAKFPKTVADAWERRQHKAPARASVWRRVSGWFQLPLPAAMAGAAVAATLVLALVHRPPIRHAAVPVAAAPVAAAPALALAEVASADDDGTSSLLGEDDPLDALDLADTKLVAKVGAGVETTGSDEGSELSPSPAEELELLETDDLRAVAQALRGRSQI